MKYLHLVGSLSLASTSSWAIYSTRSCQQYDKLAYSFFLSAGVVGLLSAISDDDQVEKHAEKGTAQCLMFATSFLTTEICLEAEMDSLLAYSNLILPVLHLVTGSKPNRERIMDSARWYSTVLLACASHAYDLPIGYLLTLTLVLGEPTTSKYYAFMMALSVFLAKKTIVKIKAAV